MWILLSLIPFLRRVLRAFRGRFAASAIYRSKTPDGPTVDQLAATLGVIVTVSVSGVYPITIGLLVLRKGKGHLEWFKLVFSLICIIMSSAIWYKSMHIRISQIRQPDFNPYECGGINPMQYCLLSSIGSVSEYIPKDFNVYYQWTSAGPLVIACALAIEKTFPITTWHLPACISKTARLVLISIAPFFAEAWLLWGNVSVLVDLCRLGSTKVSKITFGHSGRSLRLGFSYQCSLSGCISLSVSPFPHQLF